MTRLDWRESFVAKASTQFRAWSGLQHHGAGKHPRSKNPNSRGYSCGLRMTKKSSLTDPAFRLRGWFQLPRVALLFHDRRRYLSFAHHDSALEVTARSLD